MIGYRHLPPQTHYLLGRLQSGDCLTEDQLQPLLELAVGAVTASTSAEDLLDQFPALTPELAAQTAMMAKKYQVHMHCTESCVPDSMGSDQTCRFFFPRLPSLFHLMARCPVQRTNEQKRALASIESLHRKVQGQLRLFQGEDVPQEQDTAESLVDLLNQAAGGGPVELPQAPGVFLWANMIFENIPETRAMMESCHQFSPNSEENCRTLALYHHTLKYRANARYIPRRKISEAYVECFNPVQLVAANANVSADVITHTVQKLMAYCTKGGSSRFGVLDAAHEVRARQSPGVFESADILEERFERCREVTLGEALHSLDSGLHLSESNYGVTWVNTSLPGQPGRQVGGHQQEYTDNGQFTATTADMLRYTKRPGTLECLCFGQFMMWYRLAKPGQEQANPRFNQVVNICSPEDLAPPAGHTDLPAVLRLTDGTVLRLRRLPCALNWGPASSYASIMLFTVHMTLLIILLVILLIILNFNL